MQSTADAAISARSRRSGYTDMAIGLAAMLGIRLPQNFLRPYGAPSLIDFWRRWHITLSFWLRDYLYIPLGGSHGGRLRQACNILITMALGGLWHGANWDIFGLGDSVWRRRRDRPRAVRFFGDGTVRTAAMDRRRFDVLFRDAGLGDLSR